MATVPGSMLLAASSPYARRGALWEAFNRYHKQDGPVLVWQAPTAVMNPSVPQSLIDEAMAEDPARAAAEYGAEFRSDIESYIAREVVVGATPPGLRERAPIPGVFYKPSWTPAAVPPTPSPWPLPTTRTAGQSWTPFASTARPLALNR